MHVAAVFADLHVDDIATARDFYTDFLGFSVEGFDMGWVARFESPDGKARIQLVTREIVHPLTDEPWGVRRFFVRAPDGTVVNVVSHRDD